MVGSHVLPREQEAVEIRGRDGLNLAAKAVNRQAVNARQQASFTPLLARARELATQHKPLAFDYELQSQTGKGKARFYRIVAIHP